MVADPTTVVARDRKEERSEGVGGEQCLTKILLLLAKTIK